MSVHKVALVTAGSAGLGAQIARVLAPDFRVVINFANNESRAKSLVEELEKIPCSTKDPQSPRFDFIRADVGDRSALQNLVEETLRKFGRIDAVISNAGWTQVRGFESLDANMVEDDWDRCFRYNVKAHLWLLHAARPELDKNEGTFVTTASIAGVKPSGSSLPYAVTKSAAIHLSKCLASMCSPRIRINSVSPGLLLTEWGMKFPEEKREAARNSTKLKRLPTVEDVAEQVRTLILSKSMTGQNIIIDSGASI